MIYLYKKTGYWTWITSGLDWSGVDFWLRNMCCTELVRTSGLDFYTVGLLPQYMDLVIDLYRSESV